MGIVTLLERFPGYTLRTLLEEDGELLKMVRIVDAERAREREEVSDSE